jgi:hypothetical protein
MTHGQELFAAFAVGLTISHAIRWGESRYLAWRFKRAMRKVEERVANCTHPTTIVIGAGPDIRCVRCHGIFSYHARTWSPYQILPPGVKATFYNETTTPYR